MRAGSLVIGSCESNAYAIAACAPANADSRPLVKKMPATKLRDLPLPGGEVEVISPGGDLPVAHLEDARHRQRHLPTVHREAVDPLGEHEAPAAGNGEHPELRRPGRR